MQIRKTLAVLAAGCLMATTAIADSWTLDSEMSNISFGSIKNDYAGESHRFKDVSGSVDDTGMVRIEIALASVETMIDIRNERLAEFVFKNSPTATITAQLDMNTLSGLAVGDAATTDVTGTLNLGGTDVELDASFFVMRVQDDQVLATNEGMIMLSTEDAGIDAGIDKLQELASLDGITRVSPVTLRLIFNLDG